MRVAKEEATKAEDTEAERGGDVQSCADSAESKTIRTTSS